MPQHVSRLYHASDFRVHPTPPFSFELTVRNPAGWNLFTYDEAYEDGTLWTGIRFEGRAVGLRIRSTGTIAKPRLTVSAYAARRMSGGATRRLRELISRSLGAEQNLTRFYEFAAHDPILKHAVEDLYGMHDAQGVSLFNSVILSICLQMARLKRSNQMMEAIGREYGETIAFDGKRVPLNPTPERVAELDPKVFAQRCKLGYRAKYIVASAKVVASVFPDMKEILDMPPLKAREKLMELPGVGDYAADIINPNGGFPIDAWSVDVFGRLFFGKEPANRREAIDRVKKEGIRRWGEWSWMAFFYVAQDLRNLSNHLGIELRLE